MSSSFTGVPVQSIQRISGMALIVMCIGLAINMATAWIRYANISTIGPWYIAVFIGVLFLFGFAPVVYGFKSTKMEDTYFMQTGLIVLFLTAASWLMVAFWEKPDLSDDSKNKQVRLYEALIATGMFVVAIVFSVWTYKKHDTLPYQQQRGGGMVPLSSNY